MKTQSATEAKTHFGKLLDDAIKEPIIIEKSGRNVAVVLSFEDYKRLTEKEDSYWIAQANEAKNHGFMDDKASENILERMLNAKD